MKIKQEINRINKNKKLAFINSNIDKTEKSFARIRKREGHKLLMSEIKLTRLMMIIS